MSLPPSEIPLGAMRFNSDSQKFEYWMGSAWMQVTTEPASLFGGEVFFVAGGSNKYTQSFNIITGGETVDMDIAQLYGVHSPAAVNSKTRGVTMGGRNNPSPYNFTNMQFVTIASTGNASDFGETHAARSRRTASDCHGGLS